MADYDYDLPEHLIAQTPLERRDSSRLLVLDRRSGRREHRRFTDIHEFLEPGDLLVINDTRVMPARLHGRRPTGGVVELLLLRRRSSGDWECMAKPGRRLHPGSAIRLLDRQGNETSMVATIQGRIDETLFAVLLPDEVERDLGTFGEMPLPPYIHDRLDDGERYQTIFARDEGSAAAPTAGLHFTPELMTQLVNSGVGLAHVTLHVGIGTFLPVKVEDARHHRMHAEWYQVPVETVEAIRRTREAGRRVIAVGTTSCRTLESIDVESEDRSSLTGWTDIYITPGFQFRLVDGLITNFHLPKSTLLLLVSALAGREQILDAYAEAVRENYRFFSFGDAMLIL